MQHEPGEEVARGEWEVDNIEGGADAGGEGVEVGIAQGEMHGAESAHGNADEGAAVAISGGGEAGFNIEAKVVGDEVGVIFLRAAGDVGEVREAAVGHDENESECGKAGDVGIIGPAEVVVAGGVEKIDGGETRAEFDVTGLDDAVSGDAAEGFAVEADVVQADISGEFWRVD